MFIHCSKSLNRLAASVIVFIHILCQYRELRTCADRKDKEKKKRHFTLSYYTQSQVSNPSRKKEQSISSKHDMGDVSTDRTPE